MKKLFITIAFVAAAMFANAQFFIGGNLGLGTTKGKVTTESQGISTSVDSPKTMNFTIAPSLGFMFNDNMGVGLDFDFNYGKFTVKGNNNTTTVKGSAIGFKPYFRWVFAEVDNFKFYADAYVYFNTGKPKITSEANGISATADGPKTTRFDVGIQPGLQYNFTDHISMNCKLNLLAIAYRTNKVVSETTDAQGNKVTTTTKANGFDFGVNGFGYEDGPVVIDDNGNAEWVGTNFYKDSPISVGFYYTF